MPQQRELCEKFHDVAASLQFSTSGHDDPSCICEVTHVCEIWNSSQRHYAHLRKAESALNSIGAVTVNTKQRVVVGLSESPTWFAQEEQASTS